MTETPYEIKSTTGATIKGTALPESRQPAPTPLPAQVHLAQNPAMRPQLPPDPGEWEARAPGPPTDTRPSLPAADPDAKNAESGAPADNTRGASLPAADPDAKNAESGGPDMTLRRPSLDKTMERSPYTREESPQLDASTNTPRRPGDAKYANGWLGSHPDAEVDPATAPVDAKYMYPDAIGRLTLYIGNLPRASEEVKQILHRFLISLGLDGYQIVNLQPCFHKKDKRQFAEVKVSSEADRAKLLAKNYAFLFNRFIMVGPKNDLITGVNGKVCRTCGWNYMAPTHAKESKAFKYLCSECLRSRKILEQMKNEVTMDFRWKKEDIIAVLERNHIHAHNIHRRLYLENCPRKVCRKIGCNFAHNKRQQFLGQVVNEYRQIDEDLASMPTAAIVTSKSRSGSRSESPGRGLPAEEPINGLKPSATQLSMVASKSRSMSRSESPVRGGHPVEETINGLKPSWVSGLPDRPAPRHSRRSASVDSHHRRMSPGSSHHHSGARRPSVFAIPTTRNSTSPQHRAILRSSPSSGSSMYVETGSVNTTPTRLTRVENLSDVPEAKRRRLPINPGDPIPEAVPSLETIRRGAPTTVHGSNGMRNRTIDSQIPPPTTIPAGIPAEVDTALSASTRRRRRKLSRSRGRSTSPGHGQRGIRGILNLEKAFSTRR